MDWCRLGTSYYMDRSILRAGEAAEVLFLRMLAYSGAEESRGVVPKDVLPMLTPTKTKARLDALLLCRLVLDLGDDVQIRSWDRWQESLDKESERRRKDRERKAAERAAARSMSVDTSVDVSTDGPAPVRPEIPHIEVEVEKERSSSKNVTDSAQAPRRLHAVEAEFDAWWDAYPKKAAKDAARRAYRKAATRTTAAELLAGAIRYRDDPTRDPGFTMHPASWLNAGRWQDEGPVRDLSRGRPVGEGRVSADPSEYLQPGPFGTPSVRAT